MFGAYFEEGVSGAADEVDGALDVAILVVVSARLVVQGVLRSKERDAEELGLVSFDFERHHSLAHCAARRRMVRVLQEKKG